MYKGHKMKEHLARAAYGEDGAIAILKGAISSEVVALPLNVGKGRIFKNFLSIGISSVTERN